MKRILIVSSEFPPGPGGIGRHAADLGLALSNKGYQIDVLSNIDYVDRATINEFINTLPDNIYLHPFPRISIFTYLLRIPIVLKALRNNNYERLIFTGKFPLWIGGLVKLIYGKKKITDIFLHGSEINPSNVFYRMLTHWAIKKADRIWAVSKFTASLLPDKITKYKKIYILPNGIHSSEWPNPSQINSYKDWKGNPKLLTVGSISLRKGQHRVVKALPELLKTYPTIHYHIVGMLNKIDHLQELIKRMKLEDHVTIHGRFAGKRDLAKAYKTCDIYIMLSEKQHNGDVEGFGISILEANFYGLAAIGAKGCGIEDAIAPGINGELVDGDNVQEICNATNKIFDNASNYKANMKGYLAEHEWNTLINKFIMTK